MRLPISVRPVAALFPASVNVSGIASRGILLCCTMLLFAAGCNNYSGPSEYQKLKNKEQGFGGVIAAAGGSAKKEGATMHGFQMSGWQIDLSGGNVTDEIIDSIIQVGKFDPVFLLNFSGTGITDDQLAKLDENKILQKTIELDLSNTPVSDAGLDKVSNCHALGKLNLTGSAATAEGAKRLGDRMMAHPSTPQPFKKHPQVEI